MLILYLYCSSFCFCPLSQIYADLFLRKYLFYLFTMKVLQSIPRGCTEYLFTLKCNMQHLSFCRRQRKPGEAKLGCFEVLPGRWLETDHTRQCDDDVHPAGDKEELVFVCTRLCLYNVRLCRSVCMFLNTLYSTLCPCQCTECISTSLPIPIRYQYTLSPTSMFKPFRLAYI